MNKPNRLIDEISPYLLQHAYNPVNWYAWGEEAFARARDEEKPIFLSIGYSTCHWCHVMARESFQDPQVAAALNESFISIKVDREERPDVDAVYMDVCQSLTGGGGWPLTVFMTADQKPFFAGTYFPPKGRYGQKGFLEIINLVKKVWNDDPTNLLDAAERIASFMATAEEKSESYRPGRPTVEKAAIQFERQYDLNWGGFGRAPKFPTPHNLLFLMRCHWLKVGRRPLAMTEHTLRAMYQGGIFDHIGGGFSRYSTDEKWLAPHFEKMLYDNALLALAYTEAFQLTGQKLYRGITEKIMKYIGREMTSPEGGFYSAQDADSQGEEGKYYTFTPEEIGRVLGEEDGRAFCRRYDLTEAGNFEGKNIPNLIKGEALLPEPAFEEMLETLYLYRLQRYPLHKDDKCLTSWNALMIAAYAKAYRALGRSDYLEAAQRAYAFIKSRLTDKDGGLFISYRQGQTRGSGLLDDYSFLSWACLELYESTFQLSYLEKAAEHMDRVLSCFSSPSGGLYLSPAGNQELLFQPKEFHDGALPSGNSVAAWCLARLAALTGEGKWAEAADRQLTSFGQWFKNQPSAVSFALSALMLELYPAEELVCLLAEDEAKEYLALKLGAFFHPQTSILAKSTEDAAALDSLAPYAAACHLPKQGLTYHLCRDHRCDQPTDDFETIRRKIIETKGSMAKPA